jgi:hypothetical protein
MPLQTDPKRIALPVSKKMARTRRAEEGRETLLACLAGALCAGVPRPVEVVEAGQKSPEGAPHDPALREGARPVRWACGGGCCCTSSSTGSSARGGSGHLPLTGPSMAPGCVGPYMCPSLRAVTTDRCSGFASHVFGRWFALLAPHGRGGFARHRLTSLPSFDVWLRQNEVGGRR